MTVWVIVPMVVSAAAISTMSSSRPCSRFGLGRFTRSLAALMLGVLFAVTAHATINAALQMQTGNPTNATATTSNHVNYLIQRDQYAMDYNDTTREPNWVAWDLTTGDVGGSGRSNFIVDTGLPAGFYQVLTTDYSGSGYDRGHLCPSADRTVSPADNQVVFTMSNMMPQAPDNNQGVWASFETYSRTLAAAGNEVLLIAGPSLFGGSTIASGVAIPGYTWKIALVVPLGSGTALSRIDANTRIIALKIPNTAGVRSTPWQNFVVSVATGASATYATADGIMSCTISDGDDMLDITLEKATYNFLKGSIKGVVKTMAKMGISTVQSYRGAQIFEAVGLHESVVERYFTWTPSRIGGKLRKAAFKALSRSALPAESISSTRVTAPLALTHTLTMIRKSASRSFFSLDTAS